MVSSYPFVVLPRQRRRLHPIPDDLLECIEAGVIGVFVLVVLFGNIVKMEQKRHSLMPIWENAPEIFSPDNITMDQAHILGLISELFIVGDLIISGENNFLQRTLI